MGSRLLWLACLASILPLALAQWMELGGESSDQVLFGLALLPWMLLLGLPGKAESNSAKSKGLPLIYAIPVLALAHTLDRSGSEVGIELADQLWTWGVALGFLCALWFASSRAGAKSRWHACLWSIAVLGAPLLSWLIASFSYSGEGSSFQVDGAALADWSPIAFCLRLVGGDTVAWNPMALICSSASLALLVAAAEFDRRRS